MSDIKHQTRSVQEKKLRFKSKVLQKKEDLAKKYAYEADKLREIIKATESTISLNKYYLESSLSLYNPFRGFHSISTVPVFTSYEKKLIKRNTLIRSFEKRLEVESRALKKKEELREKYENEAGVLREKIQEITGEHVGF